MKKDEEEMEDGCAAWGIYAIVFVITHTSSVCTAPTVHNCRCLLIRSRDA